SESDRRVIRRHLDRIESLTVSVHEAASVEQALNSLKSDDIDVCLVDYRLGMDTADDLASKVRKFNENLPLVLMSGYTRSELEKEIPDDLLMYLLNKAELSPLLLELSVRHAVNSSSIMVTDGPLGLPSE
ncbi:response regulator, partial [bacterium]|nr:response regulator [bacterium]